jgi:hypothetical protein
MALAATGDGVKWARIAVRATEARTKLLQDLGAIDRRLGTLFVDDGQRTEGIPTGEDLARLLLDAVVTDADLTSPAEVDYLSGDWAAAAREAKE